MKTRNFPARKAARRLAAAHRKTTRLSVTAAEVLAGAMDSADDIAAARAVRSKKRRSN